jgi:hypothetical protein
MGGVTLPAQRPLAAGAVPDGTAPAGFNAAYTAARSAGAPFVCAARTQGDWTVKADARSAPGLAIAPDTLRLIAAAGGRLVREGAARDRSATAARTVRYGLADQGRARRVAAGLHAAAYGLPEPLGALPASPQPGKQ